MWPRVYLVGRDFQRCEKEVVGPGDGYDGGNRDYMLLIMILLIRPTLN